MPVLFQDTEIYPVVTLSYLLTGGNGYRLGEAAVARYGGPLELDSMKAEFARHSPVTAKLDGRMEILTEESSAGRGSVTANIMITVAAVYLVVLHR